MPQMPPQAMPAEAPQEQPQDAGGDAMAVAQSTGEGLAKLSEMLSAKPGVSPESVAQMSQIMEMFVSLAEKELGGGEESVPADPGAVPAMGGADGVPMGPNTRM